MKQREVVEVADCLEEGKRKFFYFKERYASMLLAEVTRYQNDLSKLRKSPFGKLLQRPSVKQALAKCGGRNLSPDLFNYAWSDNTLPFTIDFGQWGNADYQNQTSRRGFNLVVRLNFSNHHASEYQRLYKPDDHTMFNYCGHPVLVGDHGSKTPETLAWARIDLDFAKDEALIEEIQTDWIRQAKSELQDVLKAMEEGTEYQAYGSEAKLSSAKYYLEHTLKPYEKLWSEAMLTAAIEIIVKEIGIKNIYYHTHISGRIIKDIPGRSPPRSLYTSLPKRFCFQESKYGPDFIEKTRSFKKKRRSYPFLKWQKLDIQGAAHA